jgi:hypothetical protein
MCFTDPSLRLSICVISLYHIPHICCLSPLMSPCYQHHISISHHPLVLFGELLEILFDILQIVFHINRYHHHFHIVEIQRWKAPRGRVIDIEPLLTDLLIRPFTTHIPHQHPSIGQHVLSLVIRWCDRGHLCPCRRLLVDGILDTSCARGDSMYIRLRVSLWVRRW